MQIGDKTGRLLKYDLRTKKSDIVAKRLILFKWGCINKDNDFVLVTETTAARVTRY